MKPKATIPRGLRSQRQEGSVLVVGNLSIRVARLPPRQSRFLEDRIGRNPLGLEPLDCEAGEASIDHADIRHLGPPCLTVG